MIFTIATHLLLERDAILVILKLFYPTDVAVTDVVSYLRATNALGLTPYTTKLAKFILPNLTASCHIVFPCNTTATLDILFDDVF